MFCESASQDSGALTRLQQFNSRNGKEDQIRDRGGLNEYSDSRDEHGRCPWRCHCVSTAPEVRISTDSIGTSRFYLERGPLARGIRQQRNLMKRVRDCGPASELPTS